MSDANFHYDEIPYPSFTFPQTRPDRLATLGYCFGIPTAPPEKCRVLELGCGDGTNLISFAYILPESEFVGIDLSDRHIADGRAVVSRLGLKNVNLTKGDVMEFGRENYGEFDYIIAHGLFSWIPEIVREKVLEIYAECLKPNGVGYISYNAYPGCRMREITWEIMKHHTRNAALPMDKVTQGRAFIEILGGAVAANPLYNAILKTELQHFSERTPENIFHDDLAELNRPFYFHEFAKMIEPHGLQYLSEVDAFWMESGGLSPEAENWLEQFGDDIVRREQYIDFIKCKRFRSTLVCHDALKLDRDPKADIVRSFYIASQVSFEVSEPILDDGFIEKINGPLGGTALIGHGLTKAALVLLARIWTRNISFDELAAKAAELLPPGSPVGEADKIVLAKDLLRLFKEGFVYFNRSQPNFALTSAERPISSAFARWQISRRSESITSLSGMNLKPEDDLIRLMILLADGTRDRSAMTAEVARRIEVPKGQHFDPAHVVEEKLKQLTILGLFH